LFLLFFFGEDAALFFAQSSCVAASVSIGGGFTDF
jgi:hypothetical protein